MQSTLSIKHRIQIGQHHIDVRTSLLARPAKHMILIHGIGVSGKYFLPFAEVCTKDYNVHVIDLPGYGTTPKPKEPLTLEEMADVAAKYVRTLHVQDVIVVGQSMGCQTAIHLGMRHPDICAKFVLIAPTVNRTERNVFIQAIRLLQDTFNESAQANTIIFSDYVRMGLVRYLKTIRFMMSDQIEENIKKIHSDVLIIRGAKDPIVPKAWITYLSQQSSHSTVIEIPNSAHVVQFTRAQQLFESCRKFIAD